MPTLSAFKKSVKTALKVPHNGYEPRSRRKVITFNEALENLKTAQTGFVICAAFHSFGRCRKEITLFDSDFLANLDQFDLTDIQAPVKLMPLMLCSTHWGKTVYHNALFLDWLSVYGSKKDHPHFENTVVDYQSAIVIDNEESSLVNIATSSRYTSNNHGRPVTAPNSSAKDENYLHDPNLEGQVQANYHYGRSSPSEPEPGHVSQNLPEISVLVSMESYASIELGVATLEIMYQENLTCIAMTSDGWRCPIVIHKEQLLKAQELLSSYTTSGSELETNLLPKLVLCPGHVIGDLPRIYSEKWAVFSKQRLSKEEAMSKFNADFWMSVQFFPNNKKKDTTSQTTSLNRPRSTSNLFAPSGAEYDFGSTEHARPRSTSNLSLPSGVEFDFGSTERARGNFPMSQARTPLDSSTQKVDLSFSNLSFEPKTKTMPSREGFLEGASSSDSRLNTLSTRRAIWKTNRIYSQDIIDKKLITEINLPYLSGGYVHVFRATNTELYKIGKVTDINTRKQQIEAGCQLQYLDQVSVTAIRAKFPERVTKLVHLELQNFRAKLRCEDHHNSEYNSEAVASEHGEWFDVTEEVAIHSVLLWCDFTHLAYTSDGTIKEEWARRSTSLPKPSTTETNLLEKVSSGSNVPNISLYHSERIDRYSKWIREVRA